MKSVDSRNQPNLTQSNTSCPVTVVSPSSLVSKTLLGWLVYGGNFAPN